MRAGGPGPIQFRAGGAVWGPAAALFDVIPGVFPRRAPARRGLGPGSRSPGPRTHRRPLPGLLPCTPPPCPQRRGRQRGPPGASSTSDLFSKVHSGPALNFTPWQQHGPAGAFWGKAVKTTRISPRPEVGYFPPPPFFFLNLNFIFFPPSCPLFRLSHAQTRPSRSPGRI